MVETYLEKMLRGAEAAQNLQRVLDKRYKVGDAVLGDIIRATNRSVAISGVFRGQKAVFKKSFQPEARDIARRLKSVTNTFEEVFGSGSSRINPCLDTLPGQGLTILQFVEGQNPNTLFETVNDAERDQILAALETWLQQASALGKSTQAFRPNWHLKQLAKYIKTLPAASDRAIAQDLWNLVDRFAQCHAGHPERQTVGHGDCHPGNFLWDAPILWAIDLEDVTAQSTANMIATFLARSKHRNGSPEALRFGVSERDYTLLSGTNLLVQGEAQTTLPFYIACNLLRNHLPFSRGPKRLHEQQLRIECVLRDLTTLLGA